MVLVEQPTKDFVAADDREPLDRQHGLGVGGTKPKAAMGTFAVVMRDVVAEDPFEVATAQDEQVVSGSESSSGAKQGRRSQWVGAHQG